MPHGGGYLQALARRIADDSVQVSTRFSPLLLPRGIPFTALVLAHGFRPLAPPYRCGSPTADPLSPSQVCPFLFDVVWVAGVVRPPEFVGKFYRSGQTAKAKEFNPLILFALIDQACFLHIFLMPKN